MNSWEFDDPTIVDGECLYRRIRRIPDQVLEDKLTGTRELRSGAFQVDRRSGMSVYLQQLLAPNDLCVGDLYTSDKEHLIMFEAVVPRRVGWGVVAEEGDDAASRRKAHGLVRAMDPRPMRSERSKLREALIASYAWACAC